MSTAAPYDVQASPEREPVSTVSAFAAMPDSVADCVSSKFVAEIETVEPPVRYALPPLTVSAPPVGAVVSARAVKARPAPATPALFVAVADPVCVVEEPLKV